MIQAEFILVCVVQFARFSGPLGSRAKLSRGECRMINSHANK